MPKCVVCGGTDFYIEAGFYFCKECQTQAEDIREEVLELRIDTTTRLRRTRIRQDRSSTSEQNQNLGWTTWEQYNFILIGLANELVELGASLEIKMTILQLWASYLGNLEVAFTSTTTKSVPKLARKFHKRDAEIIYGKIAQRKKNRRRSSASNTSASSIFSGAQSEGSSNRDLNKHKKRLVAAEYERYVQSQEGSSEGDALSVANQSLYSVQSTLGKSSAQTEDKIQFNKGAKKESAKVKVLSMKLPRLQRLKYRAKHVTSQYKIGPDLITPMKLWAIIYLALRIHDEKIHLADMLRFGREGHLSYYRLDHLLPPEVTLSRSELNLLHQTKEITHKSMRRSIAIMAKYLEVWETRNPDFAMLLERYCTELQLPRGIMVYAERLMAMAPPKMLFNEKTPCFPNYEGRAMAFIIVVMKILFALDGITEYEISRIAEKINSTAATRGVLDMRLFSFSEWQRYIECRRSVITHHHFPTKFKREPDAPGNNHLYLKFLATVKSKSSDREEPEIKSYKHLIPRELTDAMRTSIENLHEAVHSMPKDVEIFSPSLTPQFSYLQQLLDDPEHDLPATLRIDFNSTKVGYITNVETLQELADQCNIDLDVVDTAIHFIEKIVPPFEQSSLPTIKEFNKPVRVEQPLKTLGATSEREFSENAIDYLQRKNPGILYLDSSKLAEYEVTQESRRNRRCEFVSEPPDDFGFDEILLNGKLAIYNEVDSDSEHPFGIQNCIDTESNYNGELDIDFFTKYNLALSKLEKNSLSDNPTARLPEKPERKVQRDPITGKFVSADSIVNLGKTKNISSRTRARRNSTRLENENEDNGNINIIDKESRQRLRLDADYDYNVLEDDISILHDSNLYPRNGETYGNHFLDSRSSNDFEKLYRPYREYWMYRCHFSRVKQKKFRQLEKDLPDSFLWLLEECASVVEMTEEDLYEEICLVESYYADILRPSDTISSDSRYDKAKYRTKAHCNTVKKKW